MSEWQSTRTAPENIVVMTKIDDEHGERNVQPLRLKGRLWWHADGGMYVYYTPTHWRPMTTAPGHQQSEDPPPTVGGMEN